MAMRGGNSGTEFAAALSRSLHCVHMVRGKPTSEKSTNRMRGGISA
jgi:hypothetical protein